MQDNVALQDLNPVRVQLPPVSTLPLFLHRSKEPLAPGLGAHLLGGSVQ